jgi:hypothetical protein
MVIEREDLDIVVEICERDRNGAARAVKARCAALTIGFAAYDATLARHPHERVLLRHGARIIRDSHPQPREDYPGR